MDLVNQLIIFLLQFLPKRLVKRFALRYIAGEKLDDAIRVIEFLNSKNMMGTLDVLGENVLTKEESLLAAQAGEEVLHSIHEHHLDTNLSIKLTQFGLKIDEAFCYSNVMRLLGIARRYDNFVRIDMEDSSTTSATLKLYEKLRSEGYDNVGVVIQANLRRTEEDIRRLMPLRPNVRLCKGAYREPEAIAFKNRKEVQLNFLKLLQMLFDAGCYVGIATHDDFLIGGTDQSIRRMNLRRTDYEFQMLHGVKIKLRDRMVADGHRLRIYVPFGQYWYAYSIRRFKENPQIALYIIRALFSGGQ